MTKEECEIWGQNNGGAEASDAPEFIMKCKDTNKIKAFIRGIYHCQDLGNICIFRYDVDEIACDFWGDENPRLHLDLMMLFHKIEIDTFYVNSCLYPSSIYDAIQIEEILKGK
jgi:hypothetical protein